MARQLTLRFALSVVALTGCAGDDPLVGEFATEKDKEASLRITKDGSRYYASLYQLSTSSGRQDWTAPDTLSSCGPDQYKFLFGKNWKQQYDPVGVCRESFGFFYTRNTKTVPKLTTNGYVLFVGLGAGEVRKVK